MIESEAGRSADRKQPLELLLNDVANKLADARNAGADIADGRRGARNAGKSLVVIGSR